MNVAVPLHRRTEIKPLYQTQMGYFSDMSIQSYNRSPTTGQLKEFRVSQGTTVERIDEKNGILYGVSIVTTGRAKGHSVWLDKTFVADVCAYGKVLQVQDAIGGVRACAGHPNMCTPSFGQQIGVFKNFRLSDDGNRCLADLHLLEAAKHADNDWFNYTIVLAKTSPEMFGASICFVSGDNYYRNTSGDVVNGYRKPEDVQCDENGTPKEYVTIVRLTGVDLVDMPAANDGLFSAEARKTSFAAQATAFFQHYPLIGRMIRQDSTNGFTKCLAFLRQFASNTTIESLTMEDTTIKQEYSAEFAAIKGVLEAQASAISELQAAMADKAAFFEQLHSVQERLTALSQKMADIEEAIPISPKNNIFNNADAPPIKEWQRYAQQIVR